MKKFKLTHYVGSVEHINRILDEKIIECEDIDKVKYLEVLPPITLNKVLYTRVIMWDDEHRTCDYGSYTKFIDIKEIQ